MLDQRHQKFLKQMNTSDCFINKVKKVLHISRFWYQ